MNGIGQAAEEVEGRSHSPVVSVVIPTYNRVDRLRRVLDALAAQTTPQEDFEVIIVSDGSTDGTADYLRSGDLPLPVISIEQQNSGPAAARNRGIERARGKLVLFLDDDVIPGPELVAEHRQAQAQLSDTVVVGPMLTPADHEMPSWVAWEQRMLYKQYEDMNAGKYTATARQFYTGNASLPRKLLTDCGGFDERFRRAEDVELAYRLSDAGAAFSFNRHAEGFHYAERSFDSWCDIATAYGHNDIVFAREPGREWMPPFIAWAFEQHHRIVRWPTFAAIKSARFRHLAVAALRRAVRAADRLPFGLPARVALSILYSILYHSGAANELGSGARYADLLRTGDLEPQKSPGVDNSTATTAHSE